MKIHRFITQFESHGNTIEIKDVEIIRQVRNILRIEPGETILISDGHGMEIEVIIESINTTYIIGAILSKRESSLLQKQVTLYLAILKKENFELALQKATECGVYEIIPVITERTVKTGLNFERLEKIAKEASEQSGRSLVPKIAKIINFEEALESGKKSDEKILFHLVKNLYTSNKEAKSASIFIGPEGGFTDKEVSMARESGYDVCSLGPLTLRGETAAIIATYRVLNGI